MNRLATKLHCFKIYGSEKSYSGVDFEMPEKAPITIDNFFDKNISIKIHIGNISKELRDAVIIHQALAQSIPLLPNSGPRMTGDERISQALMANKYGNIFKNKKWLIAIETIIDVDIPEDKINNKGRHFWLDVNFARDIWKDNQSKLKSSTDDVMGLVIPHIGEDFVDSLIIDHYYYDPVSSECGPYTFPEMTASASMWSQRPISSIDVQSITKHLEKLKTQPEKLKFISTVRHWYINTINESDKWKVFLWSFWGLEVLAKKYLAKNYSLLKDPAPTEQSIVSGEINFGAHVIQSLLPEKDRVSVVGAFSIMSAILNPSESDLDTSQFKTLVKQRNSLSHGQAIQEEQLLSEATRKMFHKYYKLAIDDILQNA